MADNQPNHGWQLATSKYRKSNPGSIIQDQDTSETSATNPPAPHLSPSTRLATSDEPSIRNETPLTILAMKQSQQSSTVAQHNSLPKSQTSSLASPPEHEYLIAPQAPQEESATGDPPESGGSSGSSSDSVKTLTATIEDPEDATSDRGEPLTLSGELSQQQSSASQKTEQKGKGTRTLSIDKQSDVKASAAKIAKPVLKVKIPLQIPKIFTQQVFQQDSPSSAMVEGQDNGEEAIWIGIAAEELAAARELEERKSVSHSREPTKEEFIREQFSQILKTMRQEGGGKTARTEKADEQTATTKELEKRVSDSGSHTTCTTFDEKCKGKQKAPSDDERETESHQKTEDLDVMEQELGLQNSPRSPGSTLRDKGKGKQQTTDKDEQDLECKQKTDYSDVPEDEQSLQDWPNSPGGIPRDEGQEQAWRTDEDDYESPEKDQAAIRSFIDELDASPHPDFTDPRNRDTKIEREFFRWATKKAGEVTTEGNTISADVVEAVPRTTSKSQDIAKAAGGSSSSSSKVEDVEQAETAVKETKDSHKAARPGEEAATKVVSELDTSNMGCKSKSKRMAASSQNQARDGQAAAGATLGVSGRVTSNLSAEAQVFTPMATITESSTPFLATAVATGANLFETGVIPTHQALHRQREAANDPNHPANTLHRPSTAPSLPLRHPPPGSVGYEGPATAQPTTAPPSDIPVYDNGNSNVPSHWIPLFGSLHGMFFDSHINMFVGDGPPRLTAERIGGGGPAAVDQAAEADLALHRTSFGPATDDLHIFPAAVTDPLSDTIFPPGSARFFCSCTNQWLAVEHDCVPLLPAPTMPSGAPIRPGAILEPGWITHRNPVLDVTYLSRLPTATEPIPGRAPPLSMRGSLPDHWFTPGGGLAALRGGPDAHVGSPAADLGRALLTGDARDAGADNPRTVPVRNVAAPVVSEEGVTSRDFGAAGGVVPVVSRASRRQAEQAAKKLAKRAGKKPGRAVGRGEGDGGEGSSRGSAGLA